MERRAKLSTSALKVLSKLNTTFIVAPQTLIALKHTLTLDSLFHEHNDLTVGAQALAQSASKALSALLCKTRNFGGLGFATYSELFHTGIASILDYGGGVWGT